MACLFSVSFGSSCVLGREFGGAALGHKKTQGAFPLGWLLSPFGLVVSLLVFELGARLQVFCFSRLSVVAPLDGYNLACVHSIGGSGGAGCAIQLCFFVLFTGFHRLRCFPLSVARVNAFSCLSSLSLGLIAGARVRSARSTTTGENKSPESARQAEIRPGYAQRLVNEVTLSLTKRIDVVLLHGFIETV